MKSKDTKAEKIAALIDAVKGNPGKLQELNKKDVLYVRAVGGQYVDYNGKTVDIRGYKNVVIVRRTIISKEHPEGIPEGTMT